MIRNDLGTQSKRIWLTWEAQRRNRSMSRVLNAKLFELSNKSPRLIRYLVLIFRTLLIVRRERAHIVFAQNPSIVLSLLVVLMRRHFSYKAVIDEHNSGIYPLEGKSLILSKVAGFIIQKADLVIVSNQALANHCEDLGGRAVVYPDPLPELHLNSVPESRRTKKDLITFIFVCSWADDEPYLEVLEAARRLDSARFRILITGNYRRKIETVDIPDSVTLTGFVDDSEYVQIFRSADAAIILTERDNCINCGAYEAVTLGVPGVLSDRTVLRNYFGEGFVYTQNDAGAIVEAIGDLSSRLDEMKACVGKVKSEILHHQSEMEIRLEETLDNL